MSGASSVSIGAGISIARSIDIIAGVRRAGHVGAMRGCSARMSGMGGGRAGGGRRRGRGRVTVTHAELVENAGHVSERGERREEAKERKNTRSEKEGVEL